MINILTMSAILCRLLIAGGYMHKKSVVLLSGGLDSTTCLAVAKDEGYETYALSFSYGQKHSSELEAAKEVAKQFGVKEHKILNLPIGSYGGSSLTDEDMAVPDYSGDEGVPNTYVPARNTVFLSYALGWAEVLGSHDIYIGANDVDYSGYPDCRPEYLEKFAELANLATKDGVAGEKYTIHAPLLKLTKAEIIRLGNSLNVDYARTISCYRADSYGNACGKCDSCTYRKKGFIEAGIVDPTNYQ